MRNVLNRIIDSFVLRNTMVFIVFWLIRFFFSPGADFAAEIKSTGFQVLLMGWIIFHNTYLLKNLLFSKKYLKYIFFTIVGIGIFALVQVVIFHWDEITKFNSFTRGIYVFVYNTALGSIIYFTYLYFLERQSNLKNKLYLIEMEKNYLKTQLSPHFLFNTLNNIYSSSITDPKKTPELILKLSELMRYLVEFTKKPDITLLEEINFIENYCLFERQRLEDRGEVIFVKQIQNENAKIEPLLFFPLIENAFKHGTNTIEDCFIKISIYEEKYCVKVEIINKVAALTETNVSTNTGIENVKKRLELLYKSNYDLYISENNGLFTANLRLNLR